MKATESIKFVVLYELKIARNFLKDIKKLINIKKVVKIRNMKYYINSFIRNVTHMIVKHPNYKKKKTAMFS